MTPSSPRWRVWGSASESGGKRGGNDRGLLDVVNSSITWFETCLCREPIWMWERRTSSAIFASTTQLISCMCSIHLLNETDSFRGITWGGFVSLISPFWTNASGIGLKCSFPTQPTSRSWIGRWLVIRCHTKLISSLSWFPSDNGMFISGSMDQSVNAGLPPRLQI